MLLLPFRQRKAWVKKIIEGGGPRRAGGEGLCTWVEEKTEDDG
jgi:hypothetical protein